MSSFITSAANLLQSRYTGAIRPFNTSEDQTAMIEVPRQRYQAWIKDESERSRCKFVIRIGGSRYTRNLVFTNKYGDHEHAETFEVTEEPVTPQKRKRGGQPVVNFFEEYVCQRYQDPKPDGTPSGARGKAFFGCGCTASIKVSASSSVPKLTKIEYRFQHVGHVPGSLADLQVVGVSDNIRSIIDSLVEQNLTWVNIKHMLRVDRSVLSGILNGVDENIPESLRISYQSVYYSVRKCMERRAYLDDNMVISLRRWGNERIAPEGYFFEKNLDTHQRGMYFFAFMSRWQLDELLANSSVVSMDSTHGTCVDDTNTLNGAPLAWMITNAETQYPIQFWLKWLHEDHGFSPQQFMIDNSDAKIAGIRAVFGEEVRVLLCHWHILKNWKKNIAMKVKVQQGVRVPPAAVTARRDLALVNLMKILYAPNEKQYNQAYMDLQEWCQSDEDTWDSGALLAYFDKEYIGKKQLRSNAWRRIIRQWLVVEID